MIPQKVHLPKNLKNYKPTSKMDRDYDEWTGGTLTSTYRESYATDLAKLADLAYSGKFDKAIDMIEEQGLKNTWRLRTPEEYETKPPTGWTVLHQAALLPTSTISHIDRLISLGAWRSLRTLDTHETAYDIAVRSGRDRNILAALKPKPRREVDGEIVQNLQRGVAEVMLGRVRKLSINGMIEEHKFRIPSVEVLLELPSLHIWCPIPGFYGGFHIKMKEDNTLELDSFCRVVGGSEMTHVVNLDGSTKCTDEGGRY
ncbi:hypothetical protein AA313_de0201390 [Arthrobotrys entomopaga]|nr:hypothetical protein AA313_de0201390 [Arthrobotrys entomopaga]